MPVQVDGEPWIQAPGEVVILKSALKVCLVSVCVSAITICVYFWALSLLPLLASSPVSFTSLVCLILESLDVSLVTAKKQLNTT